MKTTIPSSLADRPGIDSDLAFLWQILAS